MAAANTDKFMEVGSPGTATTLSSPGYTAGVSTTVTVGSTANWPTATGIVFAIDEATTNSAGEEVRVDGTYNEFVGTVASGTSITNVDYVNGDAERSYSAGALTRVYIPVSATRENRLAQGMVVEHNQDGTHGAVTATSVTTSGAVLTSPKVITGINDTNGNELVKVTATGSAVNELTVANAATGNAPEISTTGGDTNIDLKLTPKGTGRVVLNGAGAPGESTVTTQESTTSTSYVGLTTAQAVTVTVGASGLLLVGINFEGRNSGADSLSIASFELSGANTLAAADANKAQSRLTTATATQRIGVTKLLTGLTAGSTTVTMKFRTTAGTASFNDRHIWALPL